MLINAKVPLLPKELKEVWELQTTHRPLLDLIGTRTEEGKSLVFLFGSHADANQGMGWYEVEPGKRLTKVINDVSLYETADTLTYSR